MLRRSFVSLILCLQFTGIAIAGPFDTIEQTSPEAKTGDTQRTDDSLQDKISLNQVSPPAAPLSGPQQKGSTHISLVLVGDTGFAPSRRKPHSTGVSKHGLWQTWQQTTSDIRPHINGDINFANMESVVSANGKLRAQPKAFNFMTHPNGVNHLVDIGFNLFSMANNHSFDYGAKGIRDSLGHMNALADDRKVIHAGIGLNRQQAAKVPVFRHKNINFAFGAIGIGASGSGRAAPKRPGQLNIYNTSDTRLLMDNLATAKADYRMVSVHRGTERKIRASSDEISKIRGMFHHGNIDLVIGHHAHVSRGVELSKGRLAFYGLGNFLHQGMANMAGFGACRDYSLLARVHLLRVENEKPQLAAVEIVPLTATHLRPKPMAPQKAARRIAILNGLAAQFDNAKAQSEGVRFAIRTDGTGLYCTKEAGKNEETAQLCEGYRPYTSNAARAYRAALNSCGRSFGPKVFARLRSEAFSPEPKASKPVELAALTQDIAKPVEPDSETLANPDKPKPAAKSTKKKRPAKIHKLRRLSNKQLARMSKAERKLYWTRYWYLKRGKKLPKHLR